MSNKKPTQSPMGRDEVAQLPHSRVVVDSSHILKKMLRYIKMKEKQKKLTIKSYIVSIFVWVA
jgi:hypothetical protein